MYPKWSGSIRFKEKLAALCGNSKSMEDYCIRAEYDRTSSKSPKPKIYGKVGTELSGDLERNAVIDCGKANLARSLWVSISFAPGNNRPFHKLRHEQYLPRFETIA